jgi:6-phosphogluconolactonase (cycloisomerase 2 family)
MKNLSLKTCLLATLLSACGGGGGGGNGGSGAQAPSDLGYPDADATYLVQVAITDNVPAVKGKVTSWTIVPDLPPGLVFDAATGIISGKPTEERDDGLYQITAKGPGGATKVNIGLEVVLPARFAYTAGSDDAIGIYTIDAWTGALRFHGLHHHLAPDSGAEQVAMHPSGRFVYVPNAGQLQKPSTITTYSVNAGDGSLSLVGHTAIGEGPHRITFLPDGTHAYAVAFMEHLVYVYGIDPITGALSLEQTIQTNTGPERLEVDPKGRFLYVVHRPSADITIFGIQPDGSLTPNVGGFNYYSFIPADVAVDGQGAFAYFVFEVTDNLVSYRIDQNVGTLHDMVETPTSGQPRAIKIHPRSGFVYVACPDTSTIDAFVLDVQTGGATLIASYPSPTAPIALEFDASGRQMYALGRDSNDVTTFAVDPKNGKLNPLGSVRTRSATGHFSVLRGEKPALPREEFLFVANSESDDLAGFTIDLDSGALISTGTNALAGDTPGAVAVDPRGRFIWVANRLDQSISIFTITPGSGQLIENLLPYNLGATPGGLGIGPAGDYLYVTAIESAEVIGFATGPSGGLTEVSRASTGLGPASVSADPTGQFVYVSNIGGNMNTLSAYRVLKGLFLSGPTSAPAPGRPGQLSFAPGGSFAYVALETSELVVPYAIDSETGALTVLATGSKPTSTTPSAIKLTPDGAFAYVAVPGKVNEDGFIGRFSVDKTSGALTPIGESHEGLSPRDLAVGPTGRYLYVANEAGDDVTVFEIDKTTGDLTTLGQTPTGLSPEALILATKVD